MITRRSLIAGFATLLAAPAIIRVADLMPIKAWAAEPHGPRIRISGTDAHGNYQEEIVEGPSAVSLRNYVTVEIQCLEPIFIPIDANIYKFV